jgi:hypothetical protein
MASSFRRFVSALSSGLVAPVNGCSAGFHMRLGFHGCSPFVDSCCLSLVRPPVAFCRRCRRGAGLGLVRPDWSRAGLHVRLGFHGFAPLLDFVTALVLT